MTSVKAARTDPIVLWTLAGATMLALAFFFQDGLRFLFREWTTSEYSHGALIPLVSAFLVWLRRSEVAAVANSGSWLGSVVLAGALLLALAGQLATIYLVVHVAIAFSIIGVALCFLGWRAVAIIWFPLLYLFFMIPLPDFFLVRLSGEMQLLSSALGVWFIRLFGISVFLDGNVIDMGGFSMQVVEACSGLRYMFPLMSFGMLIAYLYPGPFWQRLVIFLSTIPITIAMNVMRIGLIGVFYEYYGLDVATGLLHDFQGWAVFIVSLVFLLLEVKILSYFAPGRPSIMDMFSFARFAPVGAAGGRPPSLA